MFDVFSSKEKVGTNRTELIDALEYHRKIFSSPYELESILEDLSTDFHDLNDKTCHFIRTAMRHIAELESMVEKYENPKFKYLTTHA